MSCKIVYSRRILLARFASCDTHGWCDRFRYFGGERRAARQHVNRFAALDGVEPSFTEEVMSDPLPRFSWAACLVGAALGLCLTSAIYALTTITG